MYILYIRGFATSAVATITILLLIIILIIILILTPWCRVLLEKLTGLQLDEKFPAFHGTRRFITALILIILILILLQLLLLFLFPFLEELTI